LFSTEIRDVFMGHLVETVQYEDGLDYTTEENS